MFTTKNLPLLIATPVIPDFVKKQSVFDAKSSIFRILTLLIFSR